MIESLPLQLNKAYSLPHHFYTKSKHSRIELNSTWSYLFIEGYGEVRVQWKRYITSVEDSVLENW